MVKVKGQLLSLDGSGSIGGAITYSNWKGRPYAKQFKLPKQPNTAAQRGLKEAMGFIANEWNDLSAVSKASWEDLAAQTNISPFDSYVGYNLKRSAYNLAPTQAYPAAELTAATQAVLGPPIIFDRYVEIQMATFGPANPWGIILYAGQPSGFTPAPANVIFWVQPITPLATLSIRWVPQARGTWQLRWAPFSLDGILDLDTGDVSATW